MTVPVYVIHCAELPVRTQEAKRHLKERDVSAHFWRSFHGTSWGLQTVKEYEDGLHISPGHVGLNLGHWALWNHLLHALPPPELMGGRDACAVVLEDDAVLPERFYGHVAELQCELLEHFPKWQFVLIGLAERVTPHLWNKVTERVGPPDSRLCRMAWPWGTHAYMVRRSALPVLLDRMAVAERNMDQQLYQRVLADNHLQWCSVLPGFVTQRTYDYAGTGTPEWAPSTISGTDGPAPAPVVAENAKKTPKRYEQSAEVMAATLKLTDPFPCLYRGEGLELIRAGGRPVATWQCARLGIVCHQKAGLEIGEAAACDRCTLRSFSDHSIDRSRLPLPDGHFNPSMVMHDGRLILASRDSWGHSKVGLWELSNTKPDWMGEWKVAPISSVGSPDPLAPRLEDPRLFVLRGRLHASFSMPDGYPPKKVRVGYVRFTPDLKAVDRTHVFESPHGNAYEKNWVPFVNGSIWHSGNEINWVYNSKPEHVVMGWETYRTPNPLPWAGGVVRGGCPPVLHGGKWYHFFHGCLKQSTRNVYTIGCLTFDQNIPYRILKQTPVPLEWPDSAAPNELVTKRFVLFPGGAVPHMGRWFIACGVDDTYCRIVSYSFAEVERALSDVPGDDPPATIRNTPIQTGQPLPEEEF